jgi:hypothetical protein
MPVFERSLVTDYTPASSIWEAIDQLAGTKSAESPFVRQADAHPEVVLAFTYDKLRSDLMHQSSEFDVFKSLFARALSSLSVPYVVSDVPRAASGHSVCCANAASYLRESGVLENGLTELITVNVDADNAHDNRMVADIASMVDKATDGRYVAVLTANNTVPANMVLEFGEKEGAQNRRRLAYADTQLRQIPLTPGILTGLLVGGLLLLIFLNGFFCCLFNLQTPKKFEHE